MKKQWNITLFSLLLVSHVLAGCDQKNGTPELPTLALEVTPPSPTQENVNVQVGSTPTSTERPRERATLPPTWTPTDLPATSTPTSTNTLVPTIEIVNPPAVCNEFGPNTLNLDEQFTLGTSPTISWRAVEGAELYWVVIFDNRLNPIHEHYTADLTYDIPHEVFIAAQTYGWEVRPLDSFGIQMCPSAGGALYARP